MKTYFAEKHTGFLKRWLIPVICIAVLLIIMTGLRVRGQTSAAGRKQPWGKVHVRPMVIVPPIEYFSELYDVPSRNPWFFPDWPTNQVTDFIAGLSELSPEQRSTLSGLIEPMPKINGSVLMPSDNDIMALSAEARARIYNILALYKINQNQDCARRFPATSMREWMRGVKMSPKTRRIMDTLAYRNGDIMFFSDIPLLLANIEDPQERFDVYKALNRVATFGMDVVLPRDGNLDELIRFWGGEQRTSEVASLLQGRKEEGRMSVDVIYLMPGFVRHHLYRFPMPDWDGDAIRDCHWTAFNFFNWPDSLVNMESSMQQVIKNGYFTIPEEKRQMGDIILYLYERGKRTEMMHSAVYVCEDIVFTKNGSIWSSPWIFMREQQVADYYPTVLPLKKVYLRKKKTT